jgi:DNA-binding CsgD family transcriptional regulator
VADLASRDYERLLDLTVAVMDSRNVDSAWSLVADELIRSLHGVTCVLSRSHRFLRGTIVLDEVEVWTPWYRGVLPLDAPEHGRMTTHPLVRHYAETGDDRPLTVSDLLDDRTWQSTEAFGLLRQTSGATRHIALPLHDLSGANRGFVLGRAGMDFTDRERAFVRRLQPLLRRLDGHVRQLKRWQDKAMADGADRAAELRLTNREITVLSLLAAGLTAGGIASRLGASPRTVHKHLENIYRKLGTSDRLTTVLRAQRFGLLPS